eukprot:scaffold200544_cov37-Prasinocladus_malaysianus.AAC.1
MEILAGRDVEPQGRPVGQHGGRNGVGEAREGEAEDEQPHGREGPRVEQAEERDAEHHDDDAVVLAVGDRAHFVELVVYVDGVAVGQVGRAVRLDELNVRPGVQHARDAVGRAAPVVQQTHPILTSSLSEKSIINCVSVDAFAGLSNNRWQ